MLYKFLINFKAETFFLITCCLILIDLFSQIVPSFVFLFIIGTLHLSFLNKYENSFFLIVFAPPIIGSFLIFHGFSGFGGLLIPFGLLLVLKDIISLHKLIFIKSFPLIFIFIFLGISAFINHGGQNYSTKYLAVVIYGALWFISFSIFFSNLDKIQFRFIGLVLILWSLFLLRLVIEINQLSGPFGLFHFGFMRDQTYKYGAGALLTDEDFTISYHLPGFISLVGLTFFLSSVKKLNIVLNSIILIFSFLVVLYAGARQNILAFFLIILINVFISKKYSFLTKSTLGVFITILSILFLVNIKNDAILSLVTSNDILSATGRSVLYDQGVTLFKMNPFFGVGFGHYNFRGNYESYPHNIIIELLSETGIFGFLFILITVFFSFKKSYKSLIQLNRIKICLILIPLFTRSMASGSLTTNITLLSFIFALSIIKVKT